MRRYGLDRAATEPANPSNSAASETETRGSDQFFPAGSFASVSEGQSGCAPTGTGFTSGRRPLWRNGCSSDGKFNSSQRTTAKRRYPERERIAAKLRRPAHDCERAARDTGLTSGSLASFSGQSRIAFAGHRTASRCRRIARDRRTTFNRTDDRSFFHMVDIGHRLETLLAAHTIDQALLTAV